MPILCVDLMIVRGHTVLLVKRKIEPMAGQWWFPGGRLLRGESLRDAAVRIAREEAGIKVEPLAILTHLEFESKADPFGHGKGTHTVSVVYSCGCLGRSVKLDGSSSDHKWWDGVDGSDVPPIICTVVHQNLGGGM
jgi:colanic acid biosynthesis protein WcaH